MYLQGYDIRDLCDEDDRIQFVHQNVPNGTAETLGEFYRELKEFLANFFKVNG